MVCIKDALIRDTACIQLKLDYVRDFLLFFSHQPLTLKSIYLVAAKKATSSSKPAATETSAVPEVIAEAITNNKNRNFDSQPARKEALNGVLHQIERSYGKGSILKLGESSSLNVECTSTGSLTFDLALGGGYPKGRVIEIYGPESSGKTTLALHAVAEVQKAGGTTAFIDAEHALDPVYAKSLGVKVEELFICQVDLV